MDVTESALTLLDHLERNDLTGLQSSAEALQKAGVELKQDGLDLVERAIALDRPEALRILLRLGKSDLQGVWFGVYRYGDLEQSACRVLESGQMRVLLELLAHGVSPESLRHDERIVDRIAHAAIVEFGLDTDSVIAIARVCGTNRGAFLLHAMQNEREPLVLALAVMCTVKQNFGSRRLEDVPLVAAADLGATYALRALVAAGAKPNVALRETGCPLHLAIRCDRIAPADRAKLVHELLRLGAVPEIRDPSGMDAYALADSRGDQEVLRVLRSHGLAYGPRQSREARKQGVRDLCLLYDKAEGLIYRIGQPDVPFLEGGDYDGVGPCTIETFRVSYERIRSTWDLPLGWFEPFLQRLERGQEFGYDEILSRAPDVRIKRFDEPSNWSQMVD